jgi:hypothetical protein
MHGVGQRLASTSSTASAAFPIRATRLWQLCATTGSQDFAQCHVGRRLEGKIVFNPRHFAALSMH